MRRFFLISSLRTRKDGPPSRILEILSIFWACLANGSTGENMRVFLLLGLLADLSRESTRGGMLLGLLVDRPIQRIDWGKHERILVVGLTAPPFFYLRVSNLSFSRSCFESFFRSEQMISDSSDHDVHQTLLRKLGFFRGPDFTYKFLASLFSCTVVVFIIDKCIF